MNLSIGLLSATSNNIEEDIAWLKNSPEEKFRLRHARKEETREIANGGPAIDAELTRLVNSFQDGFMVIDVRYNGNVLRYACLESDLADNALLPLLHGGELASLDRFFTLVGGKHQEMLKLVQGGVQATEPDYPHAIVRDVFEHRGGDARHLITVTPDASLEEAAKILHENNIGMLIVVDHEGYLAGVVSERDVIRAISDIGNGALSEKVESFLTENVQSCTMEDSLHDVMGLMTAGRFRHMPIIKDESLAGVICSTDIFRYLTKYGSSEEQARLWSKFDWN